MPNAPQSALRLEPQMIPALRAAFTEAVDDLTSQLRSFTVDGSVHEPWLGDPSSQIVLTEFRTRFSGSPTSARECLLAYESELLAIRNTLTEMEATYRRTEGDNAALWGRQA